MTRWKSVAELNSLKPFSTLACLNCLCHVEFDPVIGDQTPAELSCEVAETREQRESDIHKGSKALRLKALLCQFFFSHLVQSHFGSCKNLIALIILLLDYIAIILRVYTFIDMFVRTMWSFHQYKNRKTTLFNTIKIWFSLKIRTMPVNWPSRDACAVQCGAIVKKSGNKWRWCYFHSPMEQRAARASAHVADYLHISNVFIFWKKEFIC